MSKMSPLHKYTKIIIALIFGKYMYVDDADWLAVPLEHMFKIQSIYEDY